MSEGQEGGVLNKVGLLQKAHMSEIKENAQLLKELTGLQTEPVGVFLVGADTDPQHFTDWERLKGHRYCQAVMRARLGTAVVLEQNELACPAAAAAFGFRPLPEGLASGKGLVGFGIVENPETGKTMFEQMPRLEAGSVQFLALSPLAMAPFIPDVVVVEGEPESLMWILLAGLNSVGGKRIHSDTAILQATCVDATITPFVEDRINFSYGCYGCREATDLRVEETVLGFPGFMLDPLVRSLKALGGKAIKRSRSKMPYKQLMGKISKNPLKE
jgi:uncharacterized protein (DUF169 family)